MKCEEEVAAKIAQEQTAKDAAEAKAIAVVAATEAGMAASGAGDTPSYLTKALAAATSADAPQYLIHLVSQATPAQPHCEPPPEPAAPVPTTSGKHPESPRISCPHVRLAALSSQLNYPVATWLLYLTPGRTSV